MKAGISLQQFSLRAVGNVIAKQYAKPDSAVKRVAEIQPVGCEDRLSHAKPSAFQVIVECRRFQAIWAMNIYKHLSVRSVRNFLFYTNMNANYRVSDVFSRFLIVSGIILAIIATTGPSNAQSNQQAREKASSFLAKGRELRDLDKYDSAVDYLTRSIQAHTSLKDSVGIADSYYELGVVYEFQNKFKESII